MIRRLSFDPASRTERQRIDFSYWGYGVRTDMFPQRRIAGFRDMSAFARIAVTYLYNPALQREYLMVKTGRPHGRTHRIHKTIAVPREE